ncbi:SlyX family protein [Halovulum dunhuangense]|uniref:SlyX family protein n=1 Tax=Halovulum dunhuangense TaxID=1505036 RepID=A0A849L4M3_9RHOB|nr:SlyX family protein [Halovulum dunhuangense]NNU81289.1 SlyX family protein [Halovulum dunhuangense]
MSDPRLTAIEEALAHQAATIEDLSELVRRQGDEIDRLTRRVTLLMMRAAEAEHDAGGTVPLADQKPPHW